MFTYFYFINFLIRWLVFFYFGLPFFMGQEPVRRINDDY